jgi:PIN domain nuclease of toxin-antitoxin system
MYVTDTHSLVYFAQSRPSTLGKMARRLFIDAEKGRTVIYVPAVTLWEVWARIKEGDLILPARFDHWCRGLEGSPGFAIAPLVWQVVDESRRFPFKDPFDCLIAGTATHLGMPLITRDTDIADSGLVETIW